MPVAHVLNITSLIPFHCLITANSAYQIYVKPAATIIPVHHALEPKISRLPEYYHKIVPVQLDITVTLRCLMLAKVRYK